MGSEYLERCVADAQIACLCIFWIFTTLMKLDANKITRSDKSWLLIPEIKVFGCSFIIYNSSLHYVHVRQGVFKPFFWFSWMYLGNFNCVRRWLFSHIPKCQPCQWTCVLTVYPFTALYALKSKLNGCVSTIGKQKSEQSWNHRVDNIIYVLRSSLSTKLHIIIKTQWEREG